MGAIDAAEAVERKREEVDAAGEGDGSPRPRAALFATAAEEGGERSQEGGTAAEDAAWAELAECNGGVGGGRVISRDGRGAVGELGEDQAVATEQLGIRAALRP